MSKAHKEKQARQRAQFILKVLQGEITATQAAKILGVSRKTYYQWEKRGLQGTMEELEEKTPGRPTLKKPEQQEIAQLQNQINELNKQLQVHQRLKRLRNKIKEMEKLEASRKKASTSKKKKKL